MPETTAERNNVQKFNGYVGTAGEVHMSAINIVRSQSQAARQHGNAGYGSDHYDERSDETGKCNEHRYQNESNNLADNITHYSHLSHAPSFKVPPSHLVVPLVFHASSAFLTASLYPCTSPSFHGQYTGRNQILRLSRCRHPIPYPAPMKGAIL